MEADKLGFAANWIVKPGIPSFVTPKRQTVTAGRSCYSVEKEDQLVSWQMV